MSSCMAKVYQIPVCRASGPVAEGGNRGRTIRPLAELRPAEAFWNASPDEQARLIEVFRQGTQVKALIGFRRPGEPPPGPGWQAVPRTPFLVYRLDR